MATRSPAERYGTLFVGEDSALLDEPFTNHGEGVLRPLGDHLALALSPDASANSPMQKTPRCSATGKANEINGCTQRQSPMPKTVDYRMALSVYRGSRPRRPSTP